MFLIGTLIKRKYISPATGRLLELSILSAIAYAGGAFLSGEVINLHAILIALFTPFIAGVSKALRDKQKEYDKE